MLLRSSIQLAALLVMLCSAVAVYAGDTSRLVTFGTAGKEVRPLANHVEAVLFTHQGTGCLTHMWFGGDFPGYEKTVVRVYVDGETTASIQMELGMGHGVGFGDTGAPWGTRYMGKTGHPSGLYNNYRIPFGKSVRVTAQRGAGFEGNPDFWYILRGTEHLPAVLGGVMLPTTARLHLYRRDDYSAKPFEEFDLFQSHKAGAIYQVAIAAHSQRNFNFLEAQMRGYPGGSERPTMLSSGLEDYFLGTYYFNRGKYATPVAGLTHMNESDFTFSAYRFHDDDPIFFTHGYRLTCRCGEKEANRNFGDPQPTIYTTYAWVYEW